ncbi:hypothetical protein IIZ77_01550 [Candidatus Saccharibacteria bacterium]|nr:hypothetical protein [Candidatus Saccharibacteria bacterium]
MKKLGLFVNFQYDEVMFHLYKKRITDVIAARCKNAPKLNIAALNIVPQGLRLENDDVYVSYSMFESYFHTSIEYAVNVEHCDVLAVAMYDTNLHNLAEELFDELYSDVDAGNTCFVSAINCAIAATQKHKRWHRLALLGMNFTPNDESTCKRFEAAGYEVVKLLDYDAVENLSLRAADFINNYEGPETADLNSLRHICGEIETATKLAKIDALIVGAPELDNVLTYGAVKTPRINLIDEHAHAIAEALLS